MSTTVPRIQFSAVAFGSRCIVGLPETHYNYFLYATLSGASRFTRGAFGTSHPTLDATRRGGLPKAP